LLELRNDQDVFSQFKSFSLSLVGVDNGALLSSLSVRSMPRRLGFGESSNPEEMGVLGLGESGETERV